MPINSLSTAIQAASTQSRVPLILNFEPRIGSASGSVPGTNGSLWCPSHLNTGRNGYIASPGAARNPTRTSPGMVGQANPATGKKLYLASMKALNANTPATFMLYDRLGDISGLSGAVATSQTCNVTAGTRYPDAIGNEIWVEIFTTIGTTATTITASYTNQDGVSGRTTQPVAIGGSSGALRSKISASPLPLQAGDKGVVSIQSISLAASTGTAGDIGVTLARPIGETQTGGTLPGVTSFIASQPSLPEIKPDAALFFYGAIFAAANAGAAVVELNFWEEI